MCVHLSVIHPQQMTRLNILSVPSNTAANIFILFCWRSPSVVQITSPTAQLSVITSHQVLEVSLLLFCCLCYFVDPSSSFLVYLVVSLGGFIRDVLEVKNILFHIHTKHGIKFVGWKLFSFRILKVLLYGLQASNPAAISNDVLILGPFPLS